MTGGVNVPSLHSIFDVTEFEPSHDRSFAGVTWGGGGDSASSGAGSLEMSPALYQWTLREGHCEHLHRAQP